MKSFLKTLSPQNMGKSITDQLVWHRRSATQQSCGLGFFLICATILTIEDISVISSAL